PRRQPGGLEAWRAGPGLLDRQGAALGLLECRWHENLHSIQEACFANQRRMARETGSAPISMGVASSIIATAPLRRDSSWIRISPFFFLIMLVLSIMVIRAG